MQYSLSNIRVSVHTQLCHHYSVTRFNFRDTTGTAIAKTELLLTLRELSTDILRRSAMNIHHFRGAERET